MTQYADSQHPPNAHFPREEPTTGIDVGPYGLKVTLDTWGPQEHLFTTLYDTSTATWGNAPTRSAEQPCRENCVNLTAHPQERWEHKTGWCRLTDAQRAFVEGAFKGGTLQQDLEGINLWFTIDGVSRAFTHEFVRTRLGAAFKQHGGRDNDWRHRRWTMTEAMERACVAWDENRNTGPDKDGKRHAVLDWTPIEVYLNNCPHWDVDDVSDASLNRSLRTAIERHLADAKALYAALVDAGIAWQDARRVLPIGCQTYVHGIYNFVGFRGAAANRLEFIMDWEINCVFQLMMREIRMKCPPLIGQYLGSHSDRAGRAMFDRLQLCPPDGKFPSTTIRCKVCGHHEANHLAYEPSNPAHAIKGERHCEVCARGEHGTAYVSPLHQFIPEDTLPRVFRREQQPFFVLHPDSMNSGPIRWLWTNGHYQDIQEQMK